jgi:hypothetical protein
MWSPGARTARRHAGGTTDGAPSGLPLSSTAMDAKVPPLSISLRLTRPVMDILLTVVETGLGSRVGRRGPRCADRHRRQQYPPAHLHRDRHDRAIRYARQCCLGRILRRASHMSQESPMILQGKQCSRIPVYLLSAWFVFQLLGFLTTFSETIEFIGAKGKQFCWAYHSISIYTTYHILGLLLTGIILIYLWRLVLENRCRLYVVLLSIVFFLLILETTINANTCVV